MRSGRSTGSKPAALASPSGINHKIPSKHSPRFRGAGSEYKGAHMHNTHRRLLREAGWNALRGYIPFEGGRLLLFRHALLQHCSRDYVYTAARPCILLYCIASVRVRVRCPDVPRPGCVAEKSWLGAQDARGAGRAGSDARWTLDDGDL